MAADPAKDFRQVGGCKAFAGSNLKNPESQKSRISKIPNLKNPESQKSRISKIPNLKNPLSGRRSRRIGRPRADVADAGMAVPPIDLT